MDLQWVRLLCFFFFLSLFSFLEYFFERKPRLQDRSLRWKVNVSLTLINTVIARIFLVLTPLSVAEFAMGEKWGVFHYIEISNTIHILLSFLCLDLLIYFQHRVFHYVPFLWRFHKVHHSDKDLDVSSGFRFHPVEIFFSMCLKSFFILLIGAHPIGVFIAEVALSTGSLFNHANINLGRWDLLLQKVLVTPDMHRMHHSSNRKFTDTNFGFSLSVWDCLFRTFSKSQLLDHKTMDLGLKDYPLQKPVRFFKALTMPFRNH